MVQEPRLRAGSALTGHGTTTLAALTGGTQYWVVVSATGDSWLAWIDSIYDQVDSHTYAYNITVYQIPLPSAICHQRADKNSPTRTNKKIRRAQIEAAADERGPSRTEVEGGKN